MSIIRDATINVLYLKRNNSHELIFDLMMELNYWFREYKQYSYEIVSITVKIILHCLRMLKENVNFVIN